MNAHKVIEMLRAMGNSGQMQRDHTELLIAKIMGAVKFEFDFGEFPSFSPEKIGDEMGKLRLPFPLCYFEVPKVGGLLAVEVNAAEQHIMIQPFFKVGKLGQIGTLPLDLMLAIDKDAKGIVSLSEDPRIQADMAKAVENPNFGGGAIAVIGLSSLVIRGLAVMNCSNVMCIDNQPSASLNKKRLKTGKVPLFSYKTLHLDLSKSRNADRSSVSDGRPGPRLHLRRGHIRRLDETRMTWVQACVVGDKDRGIAIKDYKVTK